VAADAANVLANTGGANAAPGMIGKIMASPYTAPALISGTTQLIGGAMQGVGAQKQQEQQAKMAEDERKRYNTNVGTRLFGG
jgi:O-glycosyl hydrolase